MKHMNNDSQISMIFNVQEFNILSKLLKEQMPNSELTNQFEYMAINGDYDNV